MRCDCSALPSKPWNVDQWFPTVLRWCRTSPVHGMWVPFLRETALLRGLCSLVEEGTKQDVYKVVLEELSHKRFNTNLHRTLMQ